MTAPRDPILGGERPFVSPSERPFAFGPDHKALHMKVTNKDGVFVDATREMHLTLCAMMWNMADGAPDRMGIPHDEFMRQFIAGANSDLQMLGISPLLSIDEVKQYAVHPSIVAACAKGKGGA